MKEHYRFFENRDCEYYPCHALESINCLFCFCPLYSQECGGDFSVTAAGMKDCGQCHKPHDIDGYEYVISRLKNTRIFSRLTKP